MTSQTSFGSSPTLEVSPQEVLAGDPVTIRVIGLRPDTRAKVIVEHTDGDGVSWEAQAEFIADGIGVVDPGRQQPVAGTYEGIDPAGLFWSCEPISEKQPASAFSKSIEPQEIKITAEVHCEGILSQSIERLLLGPGVERQPVREAGVVGTLFTPPQAGDRPAIIVLSGSEGGIHEPAAAQYASRGYVTLALAYFGVEGLPDTLVNIPLETVERAIEWLEAHPRVKGDAIGIWGASKGAEMALLAASRYPQIKAVIAKSPSAVVFEGIGNKKDRAEKASWTYQGEPLPYVPIPMTMDVGASYFWAKLRKRAFSSAPMYEHALQDHEAVRRASIEVEKINGPVLLVSGSEDGVWPANKMSRMMIEWLSANGHSFDDIHLNYEGAGHNIAAPYSPATVNWLTLDEGLVEDLGGSAKANAVAALESWSRINEFLELHLPAR